MPPSVDPLVDAQYTPNQQCIPEYYSQSHSVMYSEGHLQMVQSGSPHHMVGYITIKKITKNYVILF